MKRQVVSLGERALGPYSKRIRVEGRSRITSSIPLIDELASNMSGTTTPRPNGKSVGHMYEESGFRALEYTTLEGGCAAYCSPPVPTSVKLLAESCAPAGPRFVAAICTTT